MPVTIDRPNSFSPRLLTSKADGYQFNFARLLSLG